MKVTYKYNNDSGILDNNAIIDNTDGNLLQIYGEHGFKYIPKKNYQKDIKQVDGVYKESNIKQIYNRPVICKEAEDSIVYDDNVVVSVKTKYYFGIDSLQAKLIKPDNTCGFISHSINIGNCSFIKLSITSNQDISSLETYIIDGSNEYPILPIETTKVVNEKLFFNMDTRFLMDNTKDVLIKKNNEKTSLKINDLKNNSDINYNNDLYTVSYTPIIQSQLYYPKQDKIKVKIIQRNNNVNIKTINILKYGGDKIWTI